MKQASAIAPLTRGQLQVLLPALAAVLLPHLLRQPPWMGLLVLACGGWALLVVARRRPPAAGWLRTLLTLAAAGGVVLEYGTVLGRDSGTALLTLMLALKLLELRSRRDVLLVLYLGYFLVLAQLFYSQSIPTALYLLGAIWALTTVLLNLNGSGARPAARLAGATLLQALPIMLLLFVLFPRLPGPLWALPEDAGRATTGLSEEMTPGMISDLSRSDRVAFRVEFAGEPPPREALYWRGLVLGDYDGRRWRRAAAPTAQRATDEPLASADQQYTITLQPHGARWLFALDRPLEAPTEASLNPRLELTADASISSTRRYSLRSANTPLWPAELSASERERYLALPPGHHPRAHQLAQEWRAAGKDEAEILAAAVRFFTTRPFVYTLRPPLYREDPVDQFLFDGQRGFCEHYASAFTVLLRAAGVPARVVTGYLGGELNPLGDYMIVRQADAHAWTEVWLPGQGWLRTDPTGLVAPQRVELGLGALGADEPVPRLARSGDDWGRRLLLRLDAVNQGWDRWVLGYGPELQRQLLQRLGLGGGLGLALSLAAALGLCLLLLTLYLLLGDRRPPADAASAEYARFCRRLARRGLVRRTDETASAFADRVTTQCPELAADVRRITRLYLAQRYGRTPTRHGFEQLRRAVAGFRGR